MKLAWCDKVALVVWGFFMMMVWAGSSFDLAWWSHAHVLLGAFKAFMIVWIPLRALDLLFGGHHLRSKYGNNSPHSGGTK